MYSVIEKTYEFAADAERIWPAVTQTNLLSEIIGSGLGAGHYEAVDELQPDGSVLRRAKGDKLKPLASEWTEDLGEWVYARYCHQRRWFSPDGDQFLALTVILEPAGETTRVKMKAEASSKKLAMWVAVKLGIMQRGVEHTAGRMVALIEAEISRPPEESDPLIALPYVAPKLDARAEARLPAVRQALTRLAGDEPLTEKLIDFLVRAPSDFLARIRPLERARAWHADPDEVVDLFLAAHAVGLLSLRWEVLCPNCRSSKAPAETLDALPRDMHCTTCNIAYEREFSRNVELLFAPEPWLRPLPDSPACMMGASSVPHILVQRHVEAGETMHIDPPIAPGSYRLRAPQLVGQHDTEWSGEGGFPEVQANDGRLELGPASPHGEILLKNESSGRVTFMLEKLTWRDDALTGDQAIARAAFRRFCPGQLLRQGDEVQISNVALLFTDLKGSTSLYEALGDAQAYTLVRDHFDFLLKVVEARRGTLIKTMGDAIMAAFSDGRDAVAAAIELQTGVAAFNEGRDDGGVVLKIGVHQGACIAVTADGKLDYFGSMVNMAARLQGESAGGDIVLSSPLAEAVGPDALNAPDGRFVPKQESGILRGFDHPVPFWRLTQPDNLPAP